MSVSLRNEEGFCFMQRIRSKTPILAYKRFDNVQKKMQSIVDKFLRPYCTNNYYVKKKNSSRYFTDDFLKIIRQCLESDSKNVAAAA